MNTSYPYNRLQQHRLNRCMRVLYWHIVAAGVLACGMLVHGQAYAAADISENTVQSVPDAYGNADAQYRFRAGSGGLNYTGTPYTHPQNFTIQARVQLRGPDHMRVHTIYAFTQDSAHGNNNEGESVLFAVRGNNGTPGSYALVLRIDNAGENALSCAKTDGTTLTDFMFQTENDVAVVRDHDNSMTYFYVNGVQVCAISDTRTVNTGVSHRFVMGMERPNVGFSATSGWNMWGDLDEFKLSDVAVSASKILSDFTFGHLRSDSDTHFLYYYHGALGSTEKRSQNTDVESTVSTFQVQAAKVTATVGENLTMTGSFLNPVFTPKYLYLRRDPLDTKVWQVSGTGVIKVYSPNPSDPATSADLQAISTVTRSGSTIARNFTFTHKFTYAGTFSPQITLSNCDYNNYSNGGAGCVGVQRTLANAPLVISSSSLTTYHNKFSASAYEIKLGDTITFKYTIDSTACTTHGTPSIVTFHSGENTYVMSGSIVSGGSFTYKYQALGLNNSGIAKPYIGVVCSSDVTRFNLHTGGEWYSTFPVWLGGSIYASNAASITVHDSDYKQVPATQADYVNGGDSSGYSTGTGHNISFFADRYTAAQGQKINFRIRYFTPFAVSTVELLPDSTLTGGAFTVIGTGSSKGKEIYVPVIYTEPGVVYPEVIIKSTSFDINNPATYDIWYLGGTSNVNLAKGITITNDQIYAGSLFDTSDGIFGLDPSTFQVSFGNTDNILIKLAEEFVTIILKALLFVANFLWDILKSSPVFSFIDHVMHPRAGQEFNYPSNFLDAPKSFTPADADFVVAYADEVKSVMIIWMFNLLIFYWFIRFTLRSLLS